MEKDHPILKEPIEKIDFSDEFKAICALNKFKDLSEVLTYDIDLLLKKYGFTMHGMMELVEIQEKYNLGRLLKE